MEVYDKLLKLTNFFTNLIVKSCSLQLCNQHISSLPRNPTKLYPHSRTDISCVLICKVCKNIPVLIHYSNHLLAFTRYCLKVHSWEYSALRTVIVLSFCYIFIYSFIHLSTCLIIHLSVYVLCVYLIYSSIYLSTYLFIYHEGYYKTRQCWWHC